MIPVLVMGVPVFDTTLVFLSRLRRGKNPLTTPGRDHISHRLALLTGSRREAVLLCYLLAGALGLGAIFITQANVIEATVVAIAVGATMLYGLWFFEFRNGGVRQP
ncbi:MAG: undecaprenyl/decaprenyl-phosphate alpha-N-acetylglucosaminyl 1-phosphate transferase, partial [Caldilineaceae bacterium]|nr:undecaprenyl/decaprenyl-phosphate alpha-N-acetylglucosaminyl 1-phosphate transferase [Caldilineaceae bacterium]